MPLPTSIEPLNRPSARQAVFDQLRIWLEDGVLGPGDPIRDGEIASRLGVSRTPVREALQMLESQGAVEMVPGRLTRVAPMSPTDVALLYAPLAALHGVAAERGTPAAAEAEIELMRRHNDRLLAAIEDQEPAEARDADRDFHGVLLTLAANPYLMTAIEPLMINARRLEALYFRDGKPGRQSYAEHREIINAVAAGDAAAAAALTRRNFSRFWAPSAYEPVPSSGDAEDR